MSRFSSDGQITFGKYTGKKEDLRLHPDQDEKIVDEDQDAKMRINRSRYKTKQTRERRKGGSSRDSRRELLADGAS